MSLSLLLGGNCCCCCVCVQTPRIPSSNNHVARSRTTAIVIPQPASQPASQPIHPSVHHLSSCLVSTPTRFGQATSFERSLSCESANCARVCRLPLMILQRQRCDCRQQFKNSTRPMSVFCFRLVFFSLCPFLGSCCRVLLPRTRSTYLVTLLQTHHLFASR